MERKIIPEGDAILLQLLDKGQKVLTIKEQKTDSHLTLSLSGSLKSDTEHDFEDELMAAAVMGMEVVLELEGVTHLSAACANAMLRIQQCMDKLNRGSLLLTKVPSEIFMRMEQIGLTELLMIE